MATGCGPAAGIEERLRERNRVCHLFFERESIHLARAARALADRFRDGGRLLAFGRGPYATDAQHVAVEFVHPVIVGKRALPALDVSATFESSIDTMLEPADAVMGLGPPAGDPIVQAVLLKAQARGALVLALPGDAGPYAFAAVTDDPLVHQELLEMVYHTLWESVHVFLEHGELDQQPGDAGFLYPFLGHEKQPTDQLVTEVASSILAKVREDEVLRERVAGELAEDMVRVARLMRNRLDRGGQLILFGNGGSATDANDWAVDCLDPPPGCRPRRALSLALDTASVTAIANDVGADAIFLRQLIAHARPDDVAVAISTSGGSRNVILALEAARSRNLATVALLGGDGGDIVRRNLADCVLVVPSDYIPRIQEIQASMYHIIRELVG